MTKASDRMIGHELVLAARLHRLRSAQHLSAIGLFPGQERALQTLALEGEMSMGELATKLRVRPPTVSKTVARLSLQGLITRGSGSADGRVVRVKLTVEGQALATKVDGLSDVLEQELAGDLDGKDRKKLRKLLRKATTALSKLTGSADLVEEEGDQEADESETA
jgi:MarR family transcriptional regulator, transcriptional regulator for hemolysin